ncbi:cytochrome-c oxidase, cbb3-type subunit III [Coralloluteibacterium thermophilus]|uniref:Cbb3-type cytochrome c oxidase subunit n=1 Tax=Coralloluteibacterium thermophilum TaxID=2707049 RepID=A0ABV9NHW9_9GAMM
MSASWSWYVIVLTVLNIVGLVWLLFATARRRPADEKPATDTGHTWDEDIRELNNPLPRWWLWLFVLTVVFSIGYLVAYPGLGNIPGRLGWTSEKEMLQAMADNRARLDAVYAGFRGKPLDALVDDPDAVKIGRNVFANNCAGCHGSDARGATGYPNLVDGNWIHGGDADAVVASILHGRIGVMPGWGSVLGDDGVREVADYVRRLSGQSHVDTLAMRGKSRFEAICAGCHGVDGRGNPALGAPNLTANAWIYGGSREAIRETIANGRHSVMPAWDRILGEDQVRLAAAWLLAQERDLREATADDEGIALTGGGR